MNRNTIVTSTELENALQGASLEAMKSVPAPGEGELPPMPDDAEVLRELQKALAKIKEEDRGDGVFATPRDSWASFLQSYLAERADETGKVEELAAGGFEAKFDTHDVLGWARVALHLWRKLLDPRPWTPSNPNPITIDDRVRMGLLADWGTGLYGAPECAKHIAADEKGFDILMHLGDVYYSGTAGEIRKRFLPFWPWVARRAHLALNGNHEMYSGGYGYFDVVLPAFAEHSMAFKQPDNCFALQNAHFTLVGLDTAYKDEDLADDQVNWLRTIVAAAGTKRKIVLFSHHQPYSLFAKEDQGIEIVAKIRDLLDNGKIFAWYWGHEHRLVVYEKHSNWGLYGRCLGHGGIPSFRDKFPGANADVTQFYRVQGMERNGIATPPGDVLDGPNKYVEGHEQKYSPNGYVVLDFDGANLMESFRLPDGSVLREQPVG